MEYKESKPCMQVQGYNIFVSLEYPDGTVKQIETKEELAAIGPMLNDRAMRAIGLVPVEEAKKLGAI